MGVKRFIIFILSSILIFTFLKDVNAKISINQKVIVIKYTLGRSGQIIKASYPNKTTFKVKKGQTFRLIKQGKLGKERISISNNKIMTLREKNCISIIGDSGEGDINITPNYIKSNQNNIYKYHVVVIGEKSKVSKVNNMKFKDGKYSGFLVNGKPNGQGVYTFTSEGFNILYEGEWSNGIFSNGKKIVEGKWSEKTLNTSENRSECKCDKDGYKLITYITVDSEKCYDSTSKENIVNIDIKSDLDKKKNVKVENKKDTIIPIVEPDNSMLVLNEAEYKPVAIYSKPSLKSKKVGIIYGSLAEVKLIKNVGKFSLIEGRDYNKNKLIKGYVLASKIKRVHIRKEYKVLVDISKQEVYVYKGEKFYKRIHCSTGRNSTPTPRGRYLIGMRGKFFYKDNVRADNWVRFNNDYMFHSILYDKKTGKVLKNPIKNIGKKASHGCIRLPAKEAKWFCDTIPAGTLVIIQT